MITNPGFTGTIGPQGVQGSQGIPGIPGFEGIDGEDGLIIPGGASSVIGVSFSGVSPNRVISLVIQDGANTITVPIATY